MLSERAEKPRGKALFLKEIAYVDRHQAGIVGQ